MTRSYPEPHEAVVGIERFGDPVVESEQASSLVAGLARHLHSATLVGHRAPKVEKLAGRMSSPRPGDLVFVLDSQLTADSVTRKRAVGYLITVRTEWATRTEDWERDRAETLALTDGDRRVERSAWYVQYGPAPGDICRWTNCTVVAVPGPQDWWDS